MIFGDSVPAKPLAVLGNGPSLREVPLQGFRECDTVGFNAAYRYWERIGWFPTLYACLDTTVGPSHIDAISAMVNNADSLGIERFLLRSALVRILSGARFSERIVDFDHLMFRTGLGIKCPTITTGSHTVLALMAAGYRKIGLFGVDLSYEDPVGAESFGGVILRQSMTPQSNPNYFFDDYQQNGDWYHVANPGRDVHAAGWKEVAAESERLGAEIVNCSQASQLSLFPKSRPEEFCDTSAADTERAADAVRLLSSDSQNFTDFKALTEAGFRLKACGGFVSQDVMSGAFLSEGEPLDLDGLDSSALENRFNEPVLRLIHRARNERRPVIVHGIGAYANVLLRWLLRHDIEPDAFFTPRQFTGAPPVSHIPCRVYDSLADGIDNHFGFDQKPLAVLGTELAFLKFEYLESGYEPVKDILA